MTTNLTKIKLMAPDELAAALVAGGFCPDMLLAAGGTEQARCVGPEAVEQGKSLDAVCRECVLTWLHERPVAGVHRDD